MTADNPQSKTLTILSTFLLAGVSSVSAHGYVKSWVIDGQAKPGFNPAYPPDLGITAERPTTNRDLGKFSFHILFLFSSHIIFFRDLYR